VAINPERPMSALATLHVDTDLELDAPAAQAWQVFGEGFGTWAEWSDGIMSSELDGPVGQGAQRTNHTKSLGVVQQELTEFDRASRALTYAFVSGMPAVLRGASNRWVIEEVGPDRSRLRGQATFQLAWWAVPLSPLLRRKMSGALVGFATEFAERLRAS
jgi:hypothetical protein